MNKVYYLQYISSDNEDYFFVISSNSEMTLCQKIHFNNSDDTLTFLPVFTQDYEYLQKKSEYIKKIIRSRLLIDATDKNNQILPITFQERNIAGTPPDDAVKIYADGSRSKWGNGGWAFVILNNTPEYFELYSGYEINSDSCRMELKAVIKGIEKSKSDTLLIHTDSRYVKHGVEAWLPNWEINGYKTATNRSAKNKDLWEKMSYYLKEKNIYWKWIKSHCGEYYHDLCHKNAKLEADKKRTI